MRSPASSKRGEPFDIAVLDLQIGSMGGMAVTMSLRLDESSGLLPHVPVLMLLDRVADVHLAKRSGADGWLVKPLDPLRIRRAVRAVTGGGTFREGLVVEPPSLPADAEAADVVPAPSVDPRLGAIVWARPSRNPRRSAPRTGATSLAAAGRLSRPLRGVAQLG